MNEPAASSAALTKRVLFATIAAGGGHVATARAMAEALERHFPGEFETRVSDFMFDLGMLREDRQHKELWRWALARPQLVRTGQRILDSAPTLTRRYHRLMLRRFSRTAADALRARPVDLVVANHGWLTVGLTRAQQRHGLGIPVLSFATEPLDASALWAEPAAEQFIVPSSAAKADLVRLGVESDKVDVIGYPVRDSFLNAPGKEAARHELGLGEGFCCLVSLGGEGVGEDPRPWISALLADGHRVVVLTGRNPVLRRSLAPLAESWPTLRLEAYTDRVASFLAAADVVVGKAGPASVFETLAVGRPFIATGYAGLNELEVVRFLARRRLGTLAKTPRMVREAVAEYREDPGLLARSAEAARELDLPGMSERLARYIASYAHRGRPDSRFVTEGLE
jgi:1,2-diacylglycerol 3-beta-galactosyltransferase